MIRAWRIPIDESPACSRCGRATNKPKYKTSVCIDCRDAQHLEAALERYGIDPNLMDDDLFDRFVRSDSQTKRRIAARLRMGLAA